MACDLNIWGVRSLVWGCFLDCQRDVLCWEADEYHLKFSVLEWGVRGIVQIMTALTFDKLS